MSLKLLSRNLDDEQLMEQFLDGVRGALEMLVVRYEKPLYRFACRMLGDSGAAEDAFQETFLKVFRKRHQYVKSRRFKPWIYQICLNVCRDMLRQGKRRNEVSLTLELVRASSSGVAEEAVASLDKIRVRRALYHLSKKHREVLLLSHYQDLDYAEIAEILDVPVGTVKSRKFNAIRNLAKVLAR